MITTQNEKRLFTGEAAPARTGEFAIESQGLSVYYDDFQAVKDVNLQFLRHKITALIGPSGCGKSTVLRSFNRMNDLIPSATVQGNVLFHGRSEERRVGKEGG